MGVLGTTWLWILSAVVLASFLYMGFKVGIGRALQGIFWLVVGVWAVAIVFGVLAA